MNKTLVIMVGNIGSGKSTLVNNIKKNFVVISRDHLRYNIGNGDYIYKEEFEPAIWSTEFHMFKKFLKLGTNIIVDETNVSHKLRRRYIRRARKAMYDIFLLVMPKLSMKEAVDRRMKDPHGQFNRKIWESVWTNFDEIYQEPNYTERVDEIIKVKPNQTKITFKIRGWDK